MLAVSLPFSRASCRQHGNHRHQFVPEASVAVAALPSWLVDCERQTLGDGLAGTRLIVARP